MKEKKQADSSDGAATTAPDASSNSGSNKTPMFQAIHAARYQRQDFIRKIEARFGKRLVCYISGTATLINRDDTVFFIDLLHNVKRDTDLDLMLHTGGGD